MFTTAMAAAACGGSQGANGPAIEPTANDDPAAVPTTPQSEPTAVPTTPQSEPTAVPTTPQSEPAAVERDGTQVNEVFFPARVVEPVLEVAGCDDDAAEGEPDAEGEPVVELCFVAFGDTSFDGSGPDELIEGVRIVALSKTAGLPGIGLESPDYFRWWESVYSAAWEKSGSCCLEGRLEISFWQRDDRSRRDDRFNTRLDHGQQVRAAPETIAAATAAVESVVTGADGTALASIWTRQHYQFCAVHPDDGGLIAGCSNFDFDATWDHSVTLYFNNPPPTRLPVFVYFSRGRAFFGLGMDSGRYSRFLTGDIHPPGTGRVTVAGFADRDLPERGLILVPFDQEIRRTVAVVKDEDIGEFWDAVEDGWWQQLDHESPPTWAPATLLVTGADGTVTTELAAGDYLFCYGYACIYEDVTAGQDRILQPVNSEGQQYLIERTESGSALVLEAIATCGTNPRLLCATSEQLARARQHYRDTGEYPPFPEGW